MSSDPHEGDWRSELEALDAERERQAADRRDWLARQLAARGRHFLARVHPDVHQPTDSELGQVRARLRAMCGACGNRALGQFTRHEHGTVWEHGGDRVALENVWSSNYLCRQHGSLSYLRDNLDGDLDAAERRPGRTKILRLAPGPARPPSRRADPR